MESQEHPLRHFSRMSELAWLKALPAQVLEHEGQDVRPQDLLSIRQDRRTVRAPFAERHLGVASVSEWVMAGHSRGGAVAARFVRESGAGVSGLILVGTSHPRDFSLAQELTRRAIMDALDSAARGNAPANNALQPTGSAGG